jgi:fused signal recognition particle receptor
METTQHIIEKLTEQASHKELANASALLPLLQQILIDILQPCCKPLQIDTKPFVILMVGVNGAGKTTTIAKLAHYYQQQGHSIMLAAGDTFRAAAVEQLKIWGERNQVPVIAQQTGADSASVIYDALQAASAKNIDILIADTAGRLHTQSHLMEELKKVKRVIAKQNPQAPHETMLVIDASLGQNILNQAKQFNDAMKLSGITITKLDGSAKGGIVFALAKQMQIPLRFIGFGEQVDDLKPFSAEDFVTTLLVDNE